MVTRPTLIIHLRALLVVALLVMGAPVSAQSNPQVAYEALYQECQDRWASREFGPIRGKIFFTQPSESVMYRFSKERVTDAEKPAIKRMAALISDCSERAAEILAQVIPGIGSIASNAANSEIEQLVRFHNGEMTWGELNSQRAALVEQTRANIMSRKQRRQDDLQRMAVEQNARWEQHIRETQRQSTERQQEMLRGPEQKVTRCTSDPVIGEVVCRETDF